MVRDFRPETQVAIQAVREALAITSREVAVRDVIMKEGRDLATTADIAVEDRVRELLTGALGTTVVGEERGGSPSTSDAAYWLVDPICGTRNFASGTPLFAINLALVEGGSVTVAVVGDPSREEIVIAERGFGTSILKDGVRTAIRAHDNSQVIVVEDGKATGARRTHAAEFVRRDRWDLRALGSTLSFPYLAAGRVSAYVVFWYSPAVHAAAGSLLATEAGCTISDVYGQVWTLESDSLIAAATPEIHHGLVEMALATHSASAG